MTTVDEQVDENDDGGDGLMEGIQRAWDPVTGTEPALGKVARAQLDAIVLALTPLDGRGDELNALDEEDAANAASTLAVLYARGAALAIAGGDEAQAHRWFDEGEAYAGDEVYAAQLAAGRRDPERFRRLVHGRYLIANGREREARALWRELTKANATDAIGHAAIAEQKAPRPLKDGQMPTLWALNGFGLGFAGSRDRWEDGSYATTHCITALFIPLIPLRSYRVFQGDEDGSYFVIAREPLSAFARIARIAVLATVALAIAGYFVNAHFNDPTRLARQRWDATLASVAKAEPEAALRALDARLADDIWRVDGARAQRAGAEIVRLTAAKVPSPFVVTSLDQALRVVRRYEGLPEQARGGVARDAVLAALERWVGDLGDAPATGNARLVLLRLASTHADARRAGPLATQITAARLAVADATQDADPLEALAILAEQPSVEALARAHTIVARLATAPAMLLEAGPALDTWLAATPPADPLRARVVALVDEAKAARAESQFEEVTRKQLEGYVKQRPWDQWAALALANLDANDGKLDAAAARLRALGEPALLVREARLLLGQLASGLGQLEEADALLTGLLGTRLVRFQAASAALEAAGMAAQKRLEQRFLAGDIPFELQSQLANASEEHGRELVTSWLRAALDADPEIVAKREAYLALSDIVPISITAGSVKLRRAQGLGGAARDAMLGDAERTFLAIRTEAEGQPELRLGLGEIFARLGKTAESEAEFAAVLELKRPELGLQVARVYRDIGSIERAQQVATDVYAQATSPTKEAAASLLGVMHADRDDDEESERWFRKADPADVFVKTALLELEAERLRRAGKLAACAATYAAIAKAHLAGAGKGPFEAAALNNAAAAHRSRFACSGDPRALADAEAASERAYRLRADQPIIVANLAGVLDGNGKHRVLGKRIDTRALRLDASDAEILLRLLLASPERDAVLADLAADPGIRRGAELMAQYEVLAPNSAVAYERQLDAAYARRDEPALTAVSGRLRSAKGLDVSEVTRRRERFVAGELDATIAEHAAGTIALLTDVLARPRLEARTRAAALLLVGRAHVQLAVFRRDTIALGKGRDALQQAAKLWPALYDGTTVITSLLDEAGLAADPDAWIALRRERSAIAALAAATPALAGKIRGAQPWSAITVIARADTARPDVDDLRLARLLGDAAVEARAKAVLDDTLQRRRLEASLVLDPGNPAVIDDLAYLDRR